MKRAKIVVASDLHLMAPEILEEEGEAFNRVRNSDRKLLIESKAIIQQLIQEVLEEHPDVFLVTGDLSKDGELISHRLLSDLLAPLRDAGILTLVIPGNHDINNPLARYYSGKDSRPAEMVTPDLFAEIYANYGYDDTSCIERGPRLSYLAEPISGLWILALDSSVYEHNIEEHYPRTGGALQEEVLEWMEQVMVRARQERKQVIAMTHHGVLEHFSMQSIIAKEYLIDNWIRVSERIAKSEIKVILTGHFHAQDVAIGALERGSYTK